MTAGRSAARVVVRPAVEEDAEALAGFRCSTGPWYEQDVEDFISRRALEQALTMADDYRLLLAFDGNRLVGCMAHHFELLFAKNDDPINPIFAARLHLLAIAVEDQGRRLDNGTRLSDTLMATLISDAVETRETAVMTAIVALDNLRSMAMCERGGLRSQIQYDSRHVRLSGHFRPKGVPPTHA